MSFKTEDQVRDEAKSILKFDMEENDIKQGTGQITTFNQLGFKGISNKPDGWYLPKNINDVAIILETKSEDKNISKQTFLDELLKNIDIISTKYKNTIGILYNGVETTVYKNKEKIEHAKTLQNKQYYIDLFKENYIDKNKIYSLTKKINDLLHFKFGIKNLYHRMIFTNIVENQNDINSFIDSIIDISASINSDNWNGEDVMGIFFNEFNRYKKKSENGQVFTPEHITSFMYDLIEINHNDRVLDATCGSGAFLVKSMANMLQEVGGLNTKEAEDIKKNKLYGIEFDREIFALACANMLIHKDGKTNLEQFDTREEQACKWIKSKSITKVLMNPPFEKKYGCKKIVENVLNNVPNGVKCAFILPDKKLEKDKMGNLLKKHTLDMIIKLPEKLFDGGVTTSIFVFETGKPQGNKKIFACYMEDDGLERVKNQGRHDIKNKWKDIEKYWLEVARIKVDNKYGTHQWVDPIKNLSYQKPQKEFEIFEEDFKKTIINYIMFEEKIDVKKFNEKLLNEVLYKSEYKNNKLILNLEGKNEEN